MQMCPDCERVYDESEYGQCPYCHPYHSQLKRFMRGFNGVSTKYLNNYLVWNNLVNYAKESDMEKRNIFLTFVLATLKTAKCRDLSNRPAVPLVA